MAIRTLEVKITGDTAALERALGRTGTSMQSFGSRMRGVGENLTRTLTPAALGAAALGKKAFDEWDGAVDAIRVSTGATGEELKKLEGITKSVAGQVTQPLSEVGQTVGALNTRLGITGKPLARLTKQFADLQQIGMPATVQNITRAFGDWSVKTKDQADTMDQFFRVSQATGIEIDDLAASVVQFGSPLRQLGFDIGEAAAMFARFEREGVNAQTLMPGFKQAVSNLARPTSTLKEKFSDLGISLDKGFDVALRQVFTTLGEMDSEMEAAALAADVFGTRAGPDMAAAIKEGRFELDEIIKEMRTGKDTITSAADDTTDLSDRFAMLRNHVFGVIGPFGELIGLFGAGVAAIGPLVFGLGTLIDALKGTKVALLATAAATKVATVAMIGFRGAIRRVRRAAVLLWAFLQRNPWVVLATATIAIAILVIKNWDKIKERTEKIWGGIKDFLSNAWDAVLERAKAVWQKIKRAVIDPLRDGFNAVKGVLKDIVGFLENAKRKVENFPVIGGLFGSGAGRPIPKGFLGGLPRHVSGFNDDAAAFGLGVTSGFRPGDPGFHGLNRARDYSGNQPAMLAFAAYMADRFGSRLAELIHTPLGFSIDNGRRTAPFAQADHFDHVHVALRHGGIAPGGMALVGEAGPELARLPAGTRVFSNRQTRDMIGAGRSVASGPLARPLREAIRERQDINEVLRQLERRERRLDRRIKEADTKRERRELRESRRDVRQREREREREKEATNELISSLRELRLELKEQRARAQAERTISRSEIRRALTDELGFLLGAATNPTLRTAGAGSVTRA